MLSNASTLSPMCIFIEYKTYGDKRSSVKAVMKLQEKKLSSLAEDDTDKGPIKLCKKFAKQCCGSFEQNTSDPHKLLSLVSRVSIMRSDKTDPSSKEYSIEAVRHAIQKLDDDLYYFNVMDLL